MRESPLSISSCRLCGRMCGVDRFRGERGWCGLGAEIRVASFSVHHGEEPCISGVRGSGNIFFSGCVLECMHCQNYPISQFKYGRIVSERDLAAGMLELQNKGCHNINLVTPTSYYLMIESAVTKARQMGLRLPVLTNTGGFETVDAVRSLSGWIDVYLPDVKFSDRDLAGRVCGLSSYVDVNRSAVVQMVKQAGALKLDDVGMAVGGVLIRHLVLPGHIENTFGVLRWIASEFGCEVPVSLMGQYFPAYRAVSEPVFNRRLFYSEYMKAVDEMHRLGLTGYIQDDEGLLWE